MALPFFYTENISQGNTHTLDEDTSKHTVQVLRMQAGEQLRLTDGKGNILLAEIINPHKKKLYRKYYKKRIFATGHNKLLRCHFACKKQ